MKTWELRVEMKEIRKIAVVVTARPSYSRIKTALRAIDNHPDLELLLVVAGPALLDRYGNALDYIKADGFTVIEKVYNVLEGENLTSMAKTTGLGILEVSSVFERLKPDAVVSIADRFETMATAIAASYMNIPLVHIQGGEVTGNIDEKVRHAITKLADLHLVASEKAKERVIKMGETPSSVFLTGCPSIDLAEEVKQNCKLDFDPYLKYSGVGATPDLNNKYIVVLQHPVTTEYSLSRNHIEQTLNAIDKLKIPTLWFWPNVDAGADGTSKGIRSYRERNSCEHIHFFKNMEGRDFLKLLLNSHCIVGNSSVAIRECAYLGVPALNIGSRQSGRERGQNVLDIDYDEQEIVSGVKALIERGRTMADSIYGDGNAGKKIAEILASHVLTFDKKLTY